MSSNPVNHTESKRGEGTLRKKRDFREGKNIRELAAPGNRFALSQDAFLSDQKSVWNGSVIVQNRYGLNVPFLLKSSPVFEENHLKNRVFVLREALHVSR